jgi:membrane fusion protein (multidrug efflux system)
MATYNQAAADLKVAEARLQSAALPLSYARIRSPIAGRVGKSNVTQGALVTKDQVEALTVVQQLDPVYVDVTQSASELLALRRLLEESDIRNADGIPVTILLSDGTEYAFQGELAFSDVSVDPMTGSVDFRIVVPNPMPCCRRVCWCRNKASCATRRVRLSRWSSTEKTRSSGAWSRSAGQLETAGS